MGSGGVLPAAPRPSQALFHQTLASSSSSSRLCRLPSPTASELRAMQPTTPCPCHGDFPRRRGQVPRNKAAAPASTA